MSYVVVHMQKIKSPALKGMQFHHQRERESRTNFDIDETRSHENYDLVNEEPIDFNKRVSEIIESQKTGSRKTRKDAVLVNELLVTSDSPFFEKLSEAERQKFFEESLNIFAERYGKQNIAYAMVHLDEKTPHMHVGIVPMREGKLQGKNVFNRAELLWIQDHFAEEINKHGFDLQRGEKGLNRQHIEMQIFKKMTMEQELKEIESQLLEKQDTIMEKQGELSGLDEKINVKAQMSEAIRDMKFDVSSLNVRKRTKKEVIKKEFWQKDEVKYVPTGELIVLEKEFVELVTNMNTTISFVEDYKALLKKDFYLENRDLTKQLQAAHKEIQSLKAKNRDLESEVTWLKAFVSDLKLEINEMYQNLRIFLKERVSDSRAFKTFVELIKDRVEDSEVKRIENRENPPKRNRGMER